MKALVWHGKNDVRYENTRDPEILEDTDVIIRVTSTAICGSDLHLLDGFQPGMRSGDILGHETMGEVVEIGSAVKNLKPGDRVVVPFLISCGECFFCTRGLFAACERSNPNAREAARVMGHSPAGTFGYSHLLGGYAGGQAEFLRVPYADVGPLRIESDIEDEKVLFLSDIFPTGFMAAQNAEIQQGDTVAVWGCGPVAQMAIQCAWMFSPRRVIAIDCVPERLRMAREYGCADTINFKEENVYERLQELTHGHGPDRCIDAVGCEAHKHGSVDSVLDHVKKRVGLGTDRAHALREAIYCCRTAGTVSVPGVYVGAIDKMPFGLAMNKGLSIRTGQTHVHRYMTQLLTLIEAGIVDTSFVVTHREPLEAGPRMYQTFRDKRDGCVKVILTP